MTQPPQGQLLICQVCGSVRANGPWCYTGSSRLSISGVNTATLKPCPTCATLAAIVEVRDHIMAIEAEMTPQVEEPTPPPDPALMAEVREVARNVIYERRGGA